MYEAPAFPMGSLADSLKSRQEPSERTERAAGEELSVPVLLTLIYYRTARINSLSVYEPVAVWRVAARNLSEHANRQKRWTWRYLQSVSSGTVTPGKVFNRSVRSYARVLLGNYKPRNRASVNLDNMQSASRTLRSKLGRGQLEELAELLLEPPDNIG